MKKISVILFIIFTLLCITACTVDLTYADAKVVKITVDGITKTEYVACDPLELDNAKLYITYDNGKVKSIPLLESMLDPTSYDMNAAGEHIVKVKYEKKETEFKITVKSWELISVELASVPYVTDYIVGENVNPEGATIKCSFEGEKTKFYDVTEDMLQDYNNDVPGTEKIKLTYYGKDMSFDVNFYDMTPTSIQVMSLATDNFVFKGLGERYDPAGMKIRVFYDNNQSPEKNVKEELIDDIYISMDDSTAGAVIAVMMYCPADYKTLYSYTYYGVPMVSVGDIVSPNQELASNELIRNSERVILDPIKSKSYGTVKSIIQNADGTQTMSVDTAVEYNLTEVEIEQNAIIANNAYIGRYGNELIRVKGGGRVESVINGKVVVRTAPTLEFESNVKNKSFKEMEIIKMPISERFDTAISEMIQGDTVDLTTGRVRVYFDDESVEDYYMNDINIRLVNSNVDSANRELDITSAGRHELWIVYGGVLTNRISLFVTVNSRYPVQICMDVGKDYDVKDYYFGDTISISTWRYYIIFNNGDVGEREPLTLDMLADECSLYCADNESVKKIWFKLPAKYLKYIPDGENKDLVTQEITYSIKPQPITGIAFIDKPVKVYVKSAMDISFENSTLAIYYKNGTYNIIKEWGNIVIDFVQVDTWENVDTYIDQKAAANKYILAYCTNDENTIGRISIADVISGKSIQGNNARFYYYDSYGVKATGYAPFNYYRIIDADGNGLVVEEINVVLSTLDGKPAYKTDYKQYELWDLNGISMEVKYVGKESVDKISVLNPNMIYSGSTDVVGNNIPIKFSFLGVTDDNTFSINVGERRPIKITVEKQGQTVYPYSYDTEMQYYGDIDFSDYQIKVQYEAGPSAFYDGLEGLDTKELERGWWYKIYNEQGVRIYDMNFQVGIVYFELCYSYPTEDGYEYITTMPYYDVKAAVEAAKKEAEENGDEIPKVVPESIYTVEVVEDMNEIVEIKYEINKDINGYLYNVTNGEYISEDESVLAVYAGLPVITEVAAGWEIMLSEYANKRVQDKIITVITKSGSESAVKLTASMINYEKDDITEGYRRVIITYRNLTFEALIYVWNASLSGVGVFDIPLQNYIYTAIDSELDLNKNGGTVQLSFSKRDRNGNIVGKMNKYIDMNSQDLHYSGFPNPKLYSKTGEKVTITVIYKEYTQFATNYEITIFDRQDVQFTYTNTIFFYGNAADAGFKAQQTVKEFTLPPVIEMKYVSKSDFITVEQYLALSEYDRTRYIPITMYDDNEDIVLTMFVENTASKIRSDKFIDPAPGKLYVKYGDMAIVAEEDFEWLTDELKAYFKAVPTYKRDGSLIEYFYVYQPTDGKYDDRVVHEKIKWYYEVITDKLTEREYKNLEMEEQEKYEEVSNGYYLLMCVEDTRPIEMRYYETTNYALQTYTIISKVIDLSVQEGTRYAKVLRVTTKYDGEYGLKGNQQAVYYLQNSAVWNAIITPYLKPYMTNVLLCSQNSEYFELVVLLNESSYIGTQEQNNGIAEMFYKILFALTTDEELYKGTGDGMGFRRITECNGLTSINFNYNGSEMLFATSEAEEIKLQVINNIKSVWQNGINCFTESEITDSSKISGKDYYVSYFIRHGEMLTRNGLLQMLSGAMGIAERRDINGNVVLGEYQATTGSLYHDSYSIDANVLAELVIE